MSPYINNRSQFHMGSQHFPSSLSIYTKKLTYIFLSMLAISAYSHSDSIWKVTSNKSGTIYIVGDPGTLLNTDYPLASIYDEIYSASAVVVTEYDFIKLNQRSDFKAKFRSDINRHSVSIRRRLETHDWDRLTKALKTLNIGQIETIRLKPSIIAMLLKKENLRFKGFQAPSLAEYFYNKASAEHKIIESLERTDDFIYSISVKNKAKDTTIIKFALDDLDSFDSQMELKRAAWYTGDLKLIQKAFVDPIQTRTPSIAEILLKERVEQWIKPIVKQLDSYQTVMIIAGLEYMSGEYGILARLRKMDYQVENIDAL